MQDKDIEVRVVAKTLDLALIEAASQLLTKPEDIDYKVISQGSGGIFSFLAKKTEIIAWRKNDSLEALLKDGGLDDDVEIMSPAQVDKLVLDLQQFCQQICGFMANQPVSVTTELSDGRLILDCQDEYLAGQMIRNSKLAEALEHVLRKKPRHIKRELPFRVFFDAQGVRRKREIELAELARDLSEKVHENKRPIVLNYKSSYDRKIIHMALEKDERVYTKSIGTGSNRKLMILPNRKKGEPGYEEDRS